MNYSVLMSVYKKEEPEYLKASIESILNQTILPDQFIIIKDGPLTEKLDEVIAQAEKANPNLIDIICNEINIGLGPSLAKGVLASKNELIARMDSDDYSAPERCERLLRLFEQDNDLGIAGCYESEFIDSIENVVAIHKVPETDEEIRKFMRRRCAILHPTVVFKKSEVIRSGNYRSVHLYEDYDLFARMILEHNVKGYNIQEPLYHIRVSNDFFKRRGGFRYAKTVLKFKWGMFRKGYMSIGDFCISGLGQALVSIMPNKLRESFYMMFLRK